VDKPTYSRAWDGTACAVQKHAIPSFAR